MKKQICFQGAKEKKHYFEGWYYKHVTEDKKHSLAVIPGISIDGEKSHAFIQVSETWHHQSYYFTYPIETFHYE